MTAPRPMDRSCVEQIRLLMSTFGLELHNPRNVPTHRRGAALDLVLATPNTVQTVEVHDGEQCSCPAQSICCPLLGSDHYALTISLTQGVFSHSQPAVTALGPRLLLPDQQANDSEKPLEGSQGIRGLTTKASESFPIKVPGSQPQTARQS